MSVKRINWLDNIKALTIIMVVIGHIIVGFSRNSNFDVPVLMQYAKDIIYSFHMPLFICISGMAFAVAYCREPFRKSAVVNQIFNFILLYFIYSIIYWCIKFIMSGNTNVDVTIKDLLMLPIKSIDAFWYLYVLAVLYLMMMLIVKEMPCSNYNFNILLIVAALICIPGKALMSMRGGYIQDIYAFQSTLYYAFFFVLGCAFIKQDNLNRIINRWIICFLGFAIGFILFFAMNKYCDDNTIYKAIIGSITALEFSVAFIVMSVRLLDKNIPFLTYIGRHSLEVYLIHVYITSGIRPVLKILHIENIWLGFFIALVLGVAVPLAVSHFLQKIKLWDLCFKQVSVIQKYHKN